MRVRGRPCWTRSKGASSSPSTSRAMERRNRKASHQIKRGMSMVNRITGKSLLRGFPLPLKRKPARGLTYPVRPEEEKGPPSRRRTTNVAVIVPDPMVASLRRRWVPCSEHVELCQPPTLRREVAPDRTVNVRAHPRKGRQALRHNLVTRSRQVNHDRFAQLAR